jgi:uncharacterized protein YndB with AHSA1/START domain
MLITHPKKVCKYSRNSFSLEKMLTFAPCCHSPLIKPVMSEKKKFTIEYEIKSSPRILYSFLSESNGLAQWFADDVNARDQLYTFTWDDEQQKAKLLLIKENKLVRFKWVDDEPQCYFEMEILQDELTNDVALSVTDFAPEETIPERKLIWDNQVAYLIGVLGA